MSRRNQLVIPLNLEKVVEVSSSARTLDEICESLDYFSSKQWIRFSSRFLI